MFLSLAVRAQNADSLFNVGKYHDALQLYLEEIEGSYVSDSGLDAVHCYIRLSQYDKALGILVRVRNQIFQLNNKSLQAKWYLIRGIWSFNKSDNDALIWLDSARITYNQLNDKQGLWYTNFQTGNVYNFLMHDENQAIIYFKESLNLKESVSKLDHARLLYSISSTYRKLGDYQLALNYAVQVKSIIKENSKDRLFKAKVEVLIANNYNSQAMFREAIDAYLNAMAAYKKVSNDPCDIFSRNYLYPNIAYSYSKLQVYDSALHYLTICDSDNRKKTNSTDINNQYDGDLNFIKGRVFELQGNLDSAIANYKLGLSIVNQSKFSRGLQLGYLNIANVYRKLNQYDSSLYYYQRSLIHGTVGFNDTDIFKNPDLRQMKNDYQNFETLSFKADVLKSVFESNNDINYLLASVNLMGYAADLLIENRKSISYVQSKYILSHHFLMEFEDLLDSYYTLYHDYKIDTLKDEIVNIFDKKGALIIDELRTGAGGLTKELTANLIQNNMKVDDHLVSFFWGREKVYALNVTKNKFEFKIVSNSKKLEELIMNYTDLLKSHSFEIDDYKSYLDLSYNLYEIILKPLGVRAENLIIIPDGSINNLSFSSLITSDQGLSKVNFKTLPYLILSKKIKYLTSLSVLINPLSNVIEGKPKLIAFGYGGANERYMLTGSNDELDYLVKTYQVSVYSDNESNKQNFKNKANGADIIHLSLHGYGSMNALDSSKLMFDVNDPEQELSLFELYNLNINANLVVLTSCETSMGKYLEGEGVFSISRGFFSSGCKALVATLWKINDVQSASIVEQFYSEINNGVSFSQSLHKAQLNYLKSSDELTSHPINWAGIIFTGNDGHISKGNINYNWLIILSVIGLLVFIIYKKKEAI